MDELERRRRLLRCAATGRMVKQGVSMTHLHVMWRLDESGELPMSRLAEFLDVSLSNATGLIDRMAEHGLIQRTRLANDRRVVLVGLTPAGKADARRDPGHEARSDARRSSAGSTPHSSNVCTRRLSDFGSAVGPGDRRPEPVRSPRTATTTTTIRQARGAAPAPSGRK